jgi:hypothetical protein
LRRWIHGRQIVPRAAQFIEEMQKIMYTYAMPEKIRYNFLIDEAQRDALRRIKERDGIPESEQIRRAIAEWLGRRGEVRAERTRGATRKRS